MAKLETFVLTDGKLISTGVLSLEYPAEPVSEYRVELTDEQKKLVGEADLLMLNAEDHTYAKVALTDEGRPAGRHRGRLHLESALSRGLIWGSLWENVRDARLPVTTYVDAVVRNVSKEPSASLLGTMVQQLAGRHRHLLGTHRPRAPLTTPSTTPSPPPWLRLSPVRTSS